MLSASALSGFTSEHSVSALSITLNSCTANYRISTGTADFRDDRSNCGGGKYLYNICMAICIAGTFLAHIFISGLGHVSMIRSMFFCISVFGNNSVKTSVLPCSMVPSGKLFFFSALTYLLG